MLDFLFSRRYNLFDASCLIWFGQAVFLGHWILALSILVVGAIASAIGEAYLWKKNKEQS